jgi:predicted RNase H-like nuclease (RuvC/YqgF family)
MTEAEKKKRGRTVFEALNELSLASSGVFRAFEKHEDVIRKAFEAQQAIVTMYRPIDNLLKSIEARNRELMEKISFRPQILDIAIPKIAEPKTLPTLSRLKDLMKNPTVTQIPKLLSLSELSRERYIKDLKQLVTVLRNKIQEQDEVIKSLEGFIKMLKDKKPLDHIR